MENELENELDEYIDDKNILDNIILEEDDNQIHSKKNFIFKNYINKLNLQSKDIIPKHNYSDYSNYEIDTPPYLSHNTNKLSGSNYRIYNICKNIGKGGEYSEHNITYKDNAELTLE